MNNKQQLTTFFLGNDLFGIEVMKVQEVTGKQQVVSVPLSPGFLQGLVNLRGQIATAIALQELLKIPGANQDPQNSVVCRIDGNLVSLLVDTIGDVIELEANQFEPSPETLKPETRRFIKGVYKTQGRLLSVFDLDELSKELAGAA